MIHWIYAMKISTRVIVIMVLGAAVIAAGLFFVLQRPSAPALWTTDAVIKHFQDNYLKVENVNTNYAALPQNLPKASDISCRIHIIFTIRDISNNEIPNNQLFICDAPPYELTLFRAYEAQVSQFVNFQTYYSSDFLPLDFLQGYDRQATQSILISNATAHVTLVLSPAVPPELATEYKISLLTLGMQYVGPAR